MFTCFHSLSLTCLAVTELAQIKLQGKTLRLSDQTIASQPRTCERAPPRSAELPSQLTADCRHMTRFSQELQNQYIILWVIINEGLKHLGFTLPYMELPLKAILPLGIYIKNTLPFSKKNCNNSFLIVQKATGMFIVVFLLIRIFIVSLFAVWKYLETT